MRDFPDDIRQHGMTDNYTSAPAERFNKNIKAATNLNPRALAKQAKVMSNLLAVSCLALPNQYCKHRLLGIVVRACAKALQVLALPVHWGRLA